MPGSGTVGGVGLDGCCGIVSGPRMPQPASSVAVNKTPIAETADTMRGRCSILGDSLSDSGGDPDKPTTNYLAWSAFSLALFLCRRARTDGLGV